MSAPNTPPSTPKATDPVQASIAIAHRKVELFTFLPSEAAQKAAKKAFETCAGEINAKIKEPEQEAKRLKIIKVNLRTRLTAAETRFRKDGPEL